MNPKRQKFKPEKSLINKSQKVYRILEKTFGMPEWGQPVSALDELISTILSQNTNDINRDVAFNRLKKSFPNWEGVRDAPVKDVIEAIRSAGLANQKAPRIQAILKQITEERGSLELEFLGSLEKESAHAWLSRFKGVGPKTAAIVLQFSLGIPAFPVDTHIYRVTGRLGLRPEKLSVEDTHAWVEQIFKPEQYGPAHMNLIRLGREICHARKPECNRCPLNLSCDYFQNLQKADKAI
jgi:endonuclease III